MSKRHSNSKVNTPIFIRIDVHRHFPMHFFRLSLNDIPGTRTDCHMTRVGAQRYETPEYACRFCTLITKNLAQPVSKYRVSSR